jgi:hypothetical protein
METGVEPGDEHSGAARFTGGADGLGDEAGGAAGEGGAPAAEPDRPRDRGGQRGGDRRDQRVQALDQHGLARDLSVAVLCALLGVAVDALAGGVDVDEGGGVPAGEQRRLPGERRGQLAVDGVELADVSPGQVPEEGAEGGRGADSAEDRVHRAVAEQARAVDGIGAGGHAAIRLPAFAAAFAAVDESARGSNLRDSHSSRCGSSCSSGR